MTDTWRGYWIGLANGPPPVLADGTPDWLAHLGWRTGRVDGGHADVALDQLQQLAEWTFNRLVAPLP